MLPELFQERLIGHERFLEALFKGGKILSVFGEGESYGLVD